MTARTARGRREKGARAEREVVAMLRASGFTAAERAYGAGRPDDTGDIDGLDRWALEVKAHDRSRPAEWMDEVDRERNGRRGAVVWRRPRRPISDAVVMVRLADFCDLLRDER